LRPEQPELEFAVQQHEITSTEEWHQVQWQLPLVEYSAAGC
jgi:hypothetical protein